MNLNKKNKKVLAFIFVTFAFIYVISANVKDYVGVVKGDISKSLNGTLEETVKQLDKGGYYEFSDYIKSFLESAYGSGFVYVDDNGENYVITNLHVVAHATEASFEIMGDDGVSTKYENLYVSYIDDKVDLAVLKFKNDATPFKEGIPLYEQELKDGDEVFTAGFPSLGNEPLWQFGKGNITNKKVYNDKLIDKNISYVIQHSAQVDGGNSGGPLLVKTNNPIGFGVIGVNTWKALNRENTNFAIPVSMVKEIIADSNAENDDKLLNESKSDFKTHVTRSHKIEEVAKYISNEAVLEIGDECMVYTLDVKSRVEYEQFLGVFASSPYVGLKYAVANKIIDDYKLSDNFEDTFEWFKEQGVWRIKNPYSNEELDSSMNKIKQGNDMQKFMGNFFHCNAGVGATFDLDSNKTNLYTNLEIIFLYKMLNVGVEILPNFNVKSEKSEFTLTLGAQLPIDVLSFSITPFAKVGFSSLSNNVKIYGGLNGTYILSSNFKVGIGASYSNVVFSADTNLIKDKGNINIAALLSMSF